MVDDQRRDEFEFDRPVDISGEEMFHLLAWAEARCVPVPVLRNPESSTGNERVAAPLIFSYVDNEGRLVIIYGLGLEDELLEPSGKAQAETMTASPNLTLEQARRTYGQDLIVFERIYKVTTSDAPEASSRKRIEYSVRLLVRRPSIPS
jgi:hypothetical protein